MPERIPHDPDLKSKLDFFASSIHSVVSKFPVFDLREPNLFLALVRPWLLAPNVDASVRQASESAKVVAEKAGFEAEKIAAEIRLLFEKDNHLRECCGEPLALAYMIDDFYVRPATELLMEGKKESIDLFNKFNDLVYGQGPYKRIAYSHLFNFSCQIGALDFGALRIHRIESGEIGSILGRPEFAAQVSFLQPPQVGTFFVVQEEGGFNDNLFDWLWAAHVRAIELFRVIQYHKDGVAHVDYSALHFKPDWVNHVRKFGLFFVGNPRRIPHRGGKRPFQVEESDFPELKRRLKAYLSPSILSLMADESAHFRQGSLRAGDYYEASLLEERPTARLIALAVALESLFSPDDKQEISFKITLAASQLLGKNPPERKKIFSDLKDFYDRRSKLMHGTYDVKKAYEGTFVTHDEIDHWSGYIRASILRFLMMYFRGKRTKSDLEQFRKDLLMCSLDNSSADEIRAQSDLSAFLQEGGF
jgi:hypothetical protein